MLNLTPKLLLMSKVTYCAPATLYKMKYEENSFLITIVDDEIVNGV